MSAAMDENSASARNDASGGPGTGAKDVIQELDYRLRREKAIQPEPPFGLHASIMRSVRSADKPIARRPCWARWSWIAAPSAAAILFAIWLENRSLSTPQPAAETVNSAVAAVQTGSEIARAIPAGVMAPLSDELASVNTDVAHTAEFLMAALP